MYGQNYDKNYGLDNLDFPLKVKEKIKETFYSFSSPLFYNENIIISKKEEIEQKFRYKDVLLLAGGGSTNKWLSTKPDLSKYDRVVSLNHFYEGPLTKDIKVDLCTFGPEIDFESKILHKYLHDYHPMVGIELHQKWSRESLHSILLREVNKFYDNFRKFTFQTKFFGVTGSGTRLISLLCSLGIYSLSFIGLDGPDSIWNAEHSFEIGKNFMTYRCQGKPKEIVRGLFFDEYQFFWDYCKKLYKGVKLINLDKNNIYHRILDER